MFFGHFNVANEKAQILKMAKVLYVWYQFSLNWPFIGWHFLFNY